VRITSVVAGVLHVKPYDEELWPVPEISNAQITDRENSARH